jgi:hypothetical protein
MFLGHPERLYITNMFGNTLWTGVWNSMSQSFSFSPVFDFNPFFLTFYGLKALYRYAHLKWYLNPASPYFDSQDELKLQRNKCNKMPRQEFKSSSDCQAVLRAINSLGW